jgi:anti-anti-sigma factor
VPLYSCQRCGWATAASWRTAVRAHGAGCPECPGTVELVPLAGRQRENIACVKAAGKPFEMRLSDDLDGAVRLALLGGLDIMVADRLTARLQTLVSPKRLVRLDLSQLGFIDCTGLQTIVRALETARRNRHRLEVDRPVSPPVKRVITFLDLAAVLWPSGADAARPALRLVTPQIGQDQGEPDRSATVRTRASTARATAPRRSA